MLGQNKNVILYLVAIAGLVFVVVAGEAVNFFSFVVSLLLGNVACSLLLSKFPALSELAWLKLFSQEAKTSMVALKQLAAGCVIFLTLYFGSRVVAEIFNVSVSAATTVGMAIAFGVLTRLMTKSFRHETL